MFYFEIAFIALIVLLQLCAFFDVRKRMRSLRFFFPKNIENIEVTKYSVRKDLLKNNAAFTAFIQGISRDNAISTTNDAAETEEIEVLVIDEVTKRSNPLFTEVILSTNSYLCKNKGASADFNILQDICDRQIQRLDNSISNIINVPLYIGLAGTFLGIIIGLSGIDFSSTNRTIGPESITQLLDGVITAMIASLLGLVLTVWNTALKYKSSVYKNDTDKNHYYDFIQRELLPVLNIGVAGSLNSFRSVLSNFIVKFGDNINEYHDTAGLLNDNLKKQQFVLAEINKLSLTETSTTIVETFVNLKNSGEQLKVFLDYQVSLNQNIGEAKHVVESLNTTLNSFRSFNSNLEAIAQNVNSSIELQRQFKDMLELHFPTIKDHREVWRSQIDELNADINGVYTQLNSYFKQSTGIIQEFVKDNEGFFKGLNDIDFIMTLMLENTKIQNEQFKALNEEMIGMRNDFNESRNANYDLNKDLVEAIKGLTLKISKLEIVTSQEISNGKN